MGSIFFKLSSFYLTITFFDKMRSERSETPGWQGDTRAQPTPSSQRCWRSYFFGSTIRSRSFCQKWIYNPIRSFHPPEKRIYNPILSDPFRSFPIRSLSCILKDTVPQILCFLKSHDISNDCKISQNYDFTKKCQF